MSRTVPVLVVQYSGMPVNAALWNASPKAITDFFMAPPICRVRSSGTVSLTTGTFVAMPFATSIVDSDSGHSNSVNNTRYTAQVAGWYWVEGFMTLTNAGVSANAWCVIAKNGTQVAGSTQVILKVSSDFTGVCGSAMVQLAVGDYVETWGKQETGGTISTFVNSTDLCPSMSVLWVHA